MDIIPEDFKYKFDENEKHWSNYARLIAGKYFMTVDYQGNVERLTKKEVRKKLMSRDWKIIDY